MHWRPCTLGQGPLPGALMHRTPKTNAKPSRTCSTEKQTTTLFDCTAKRLAKQGRPLDLPGSAAQYYIPSCTLVLIRTCTVWAVGSLMPSGETNSHLTPILTRLLDRACS